MSDQDKKHCRCEGNWIEEQIQKYLEENLSINISQQHGYYNEVTLEVSIKLKDKEICSAREWL